jgi:hypothetical protein
MVHCVQEKANVVKRMMEAQPVVLLGLEFAALEESIVVLKDLNVQKVLAKKAKMK